MRSTTSPTPGDARIDETHGRVVARMARAVRRPRKQPSSNRSSAPSRASGADDAGDLLSGGSKSIAILVDALKKAEVSDRDTLIDAGKTFIGAAVDRAAARLRSERGR